MSVLVTGAAGFIGLHVIEALKEYGYSVIALDKPDAPNFGKNGGEWVTCDLSKKSDMEFCEKELRFDSVIHLAAIAAPNVAQANPDLTFATNVLGTFHILKLAKVVGAKRFVFASSAHVYGISPKYMPTDETHPIALQDTYTTSKILGEQLCELFYTNHNLSYCVLRLFNGYGSGQLSGYFIPDMIAKAKAGLIQLKGGAVTKDFVYIDDVVDAMVKALESCYVGPLNVGTGVQTTLADVARIIATFYEAEFVDLGAGVTGPTHMQADITRIKSTLNWAPKISIEEGLKRTMEK